MDINKLKLLNEARKYAGLEPLNENQMDLDIERPKVIDRQNNMKRPPQYNVMLNNEEYAPGEVVMWALQQVFRLSPELAFKACMSAHREGKACIATFTKDIAETKAEAAIQYVADMCKEINQSKAFGIEGEPTNKLFTAEPMND